MKEQLKRLLAALAQKNTELQAHLSKSIESGTTPDDDTEKEIAALESDIAQIEKTIARVQKQIDVLSKATVVAADNEPAIGKVTPHIEVTPNVDKSLVFAQSVRAKMLAAHEAKKGIILSPVEAAKQLGYNSDIVNYVSKATLGTTTDSGFAKPLVDTDVYKGDFLELLRNATVFNRLQGYRSVPFNVKIASQTAGGTASWVAEGAAKPLTNPTFGSVEIKEHKLAAITVYTQELLRRADPSIDRLVRDDLVAASAALIDSTFLDNVASSTSRPAGILNGVTALPATGTTAANIEGDLLSLISAFVSANLTTDGAYFLMSETRAMRLALLRDPLGNTYFNGMSFAGGARTLLGIPVITSQAVNANQIVLVKMSEVLVAQDGGIDISYSDQATLVDGANTHNLWQENKFAIRAEKFITWAKRRPTVAGVIQYS